MKGMYFRGTEVVVELSKYTANDRTAIVLYDAEDGLPYATATSNASDNVQLAEDEVFIKNYSENEGILEFLEENNIVKDTHKLLYTGNYVSLNICKLLPKEQWGIKSTQNETDNPHTERIHVV